MQATQTLLFYLFLHIAFDCSVLKQVILKNNIDWQMYRSNLLNVPSCIFDIVRGGGLKETPNLTCKSAKSQLL